jgi:hypothetical protein
MRQVDRAELTYRLFCAMRKWSVTRRRIMFDKRNERWLTDQFIAADCVIADLRDVHFYSAERNDPVPRREIVDVVQVAIAAFPGALCALWLSRVHDREREAQATAANLVADALERFEVLMETSDHHSAFSMDARLRMFRFPEISVAPHALRDAWP